MGWKANLNIEGFPSFRDTCHVGVNGAINVVNVILTTNQSSACI